MWSSAAISLDNASLRCLGPSIRTRAVKVNALLYEIIVAEIYAIKYFNAVNTTLFTSGVHYPLT